MLVYGKPKLVKKIPYKSFRRDEEGARAMLSWAEDIIACEKESQASLQTRVVMDATGRYSVELATWLMKLKPQTEPAIVNPHQLKHFAESLCLRNKTDEVDCRSHAIFGLERVPDRLELLAPHQKRLKELGRQRAHLMTQKTAAAYRHHEVKDEIFIGTQQKRIVASYERWIEQVTTQMRKIISQHPQTMKDIELLRTIPGIGEVTAMLLIAEIGDFRWFGSGREISGFSGLSPKRHESGTLKGRSTISRKGSPRLRQIVYMPALSCIQCKHALSRKYHQLVEAGKKPKQALCAISRKLLVIARAIVVNQQPYRDNYRLNSIEELTQKGSQPTCGEILEAC